MKPHGFWGFPPAGPPTSRVSGKLRKLQSDGRQRFDDLIQLDQQNTWKNMEKSRGKSMESRPFRAFHGAFLSLSDSWPIQDLVFALPLSLLNYPDRGVPNDLAYNLQSVLDAIEKWWNTSFSDAFWFHWAAALCQNENKKNTLSTHVHPLMNRFLCKALMWR